MEEIPTADYLIISASLRPVSFSRIMAATLLEAYAKLEVTSRLVDLRDFTLPLCDGGAAYAHPHVTTLKGMVKAARAIVIATPIYNYDANAVTKNLIELTGEAWENKTVGFLCAAGGVSSYMSIMGLANSMMLDFRCLIIPRFVYAKGEDFVPENQPSPALIGRIEDLAASSLKLGKS